MAEPWREMRSLEQNKLLQPACRDLSRGLTWYGQRLSPDEWRWLICAAILRVKIVTGISHNGEPAGVVTLGGSSRKLSKEQATEAITLAFHLGDAPWEYGQQGDPVAWGDAVCLARGINPNDFRNPL